MDVPFTYGKIVSGSSFVNRNEELVKLSTNFENLVNTILISPRRWGKSSLVHRAAKLTMQKNANVIICHLDLNAVQTTHQFLELLVTTVLAATSTKTNDFINLLKQFFTGVLPKISFSPTPDTEFSVSLDWSESMKHIGEILDFAEKIGHKKKKKIIICIDEFQNIENFEDAESLQGILRSYWQKHQSVAYCLYGSKRHMLMDLFSNYSKPFYQFGQLIALEKISTLHWRKYVRTQFKKTGKSIDVAAAELISKLSENHSYYHQQIAQLTWLRTDQKATLATVNQAHDGLVRQLSLVFQNQIDEMTSSQVNYLKAILNGEEKISSKAIIAKYRLGSSSNVNKLKKSMADREILDYLNNSIDFVDPAFKYWLGRYYFYLPKYMLKEDMP